MAAGFMRHIGGERVQVLSAGSEPADQINPVAIQAMAEVGIDIAHEKPKLMEIAAVSESDVVVTMGCGDACPIFPGTRRVDWELDDPAGRSLEEVRRIRAEIEQRVRALAQDLLGPPAQPPIR